MSNFSAAPGTSFLNNLTDVQLQAATTTKGAVLVLAGAGSGKTRILTSRIANLVVNHGIRPYRILAVTFTNKAAGEMRERLRKVLGESSAEVWLSTFHSAALQIIRRCPESVGLKSGFTIYDSDDQKSVMNRIIKASGLDIKKYPSKSVLRYIEGEKNSYRSPEQSLALANTLPETKYADLYQEYQKFLISGNAVDFSDLLFYSVKILEEVEEVRNYYCNRLQYIHVDEFQDTNLLQYRFLRLISSVHRNVLVVGDDDQSIYGFRGANPRMLLDFKNDHTDCQIIKLEQNFRSTQIILDAANAVISRNNDRLPKRLFTTSPGGDKIQTAVLAEESDEGSYIAQQIKQHIRDGVSPSQIAIFYRTNAQSRSLEEALLVRGIPYRIFGGARFYDRKEIRDVLAYLKILANPFDHQALSRIINVPTRGIGPKTATQVLDYLMQSGVDIFDGLRDVGRQSAPVKKFYDICEKLSKLVDTIPTDKLIAEIVDLSGYLSFLETNKDESGPARLENIQELQALAAHDYDSSLPPIDNLRQFLERAVLMSADDSADSAVEKVSLMTLHLAKGLEFDVVFFSGLEEGLLPHYMSMESESGIEEERRLVYVGITRARKNLYLTRSRQRAFLGVRNPNSFGANFKRVSPLVMEIPLELLEQGYGGSFFDAEVVSEAKKYAIPDRFSARLGIQRAPAVLKVADEMLASSHQGPLLTVAELQVGLPVFHRMFGKGVVTEFDLQEEDLDSSKIHVKFEQSGQEKRLVFRYAKLQTVS